MGSESDRTSPPTAPEQLLATLALQVPGRCRNETTGDTVVVPAGVIEIMQERLELRTRIDTVLALPDKIVPAAPESTDAEIYAAAGYNHAMRVVRLALRGNE